MTRMLVGELLSEAQAGLAAAGIEQPRREAMLLLAHALGLQKAELLTLDRDQRVPRERFDRLVRRRIAREPLAFLTGRQGFWTLELAVSDATLIPRADSETLIEGLLAARPDRDRVTQVLDLGTGSGCLLLATLSEYDGAWGVGIDLSPDACRLAASNAASNGLQGRSAFLCGDWADAVEGRFDVILVNPPYIPTGDLSGLMPEVTLYEPTRALDGGPDGLAAYARLMPELARLLQPEGVVVLEVGTGQAADVSALAAAASLRTLDTRVDLAGLQRAVLLEPLKAQQAPADRQTPGKSVWHAPVPKLRS